MPAEQAPFNLNKVEAAAELDDHRIGGRRSIGKPSTLREASDGGIGRPLEVLIRDVSVSGCLVETDAALALGSLVRLGLPGEGTALAYVARVLEGAVGCQFLTPLDETVVFSAFRAEGELIIAFPTSLEQASGERCDFNTPIAEVNRYPGWVRMSALFGGAFLAWAGVVACGLALS
jgi:hypothetical protein